MKIQPNEKLYILNYSKEQQFKGCQFLFFDKGKAESENSIDKLEDYIIQRVKHDYLMAFEVSCNDQLLLFDTRLHDHTLIIESFYGDSHPDHKEKFFNECYLKKSNLELFLYDLNLQMYLKQMGFDAIKCYDNCKLVRFIMDFDKDLFNFT